MDLDKPLEELIADKRPAAGSRPARGRVSKDRAPAVPYARPAPRSTGDKWVHDAYNGPAGRGRGGYSNGPGRFAGNGPAGGVGFTGISPRIEVIGLHYEVTPGDLKNIFSQAGTLVQGPTIRYDRSGRSTGEAEMEYTDVQQAKVAINKFDGAMTKGQTITIKFLPPHRAPRVTPAVGGFGQPGRAQTGASLLARLGGGAQGGGNARAPVVPGAVRGGGAVRGRGGPARGRGGRGGASARPGPPDAGNLDKELDAFMQTEKTDASGDVAMA